MITIDELRSLSIQVDNLYACRKNQEDLTLLRHTLETAAPVPAYHLFFQGRCEKHCNKNSHEQHDFFTQAVFLPLAIYSLYAKKA